MRTYRLQISALVALTLSAAAGLLPFALATPAYAQSIGTIEVNLPAQPLDSALRQVISKDGLQILYAPEDVKGVMSREIRGRFTPEELIQKLIQGTGLGYTSNGKNAFAIKPKSEDRRSRATEAIPDARAPGSASAVGTAMAAQAQVPSAGVAMTEEQTVQSVVVSASRIDKPGFDAPTPTTFISAEELMVGSPSNLSAALVKLPEFRGTISAQTTGLSTFAGRAPVDLRGLGVGRTLTLLDGRRFAGEGDLNLIPQVVVRRVEIVNGGASAAWGSGAVAGVVNIVLDDALEGIKLGGEAGESPHGDARQYRVEAAGGRTFHDDRGHFLAGAEFVRNEGILRRIDRANAGRWLSVANPQFTPTSGQSRFILMPDVGFSNASLGGLILSGSLSGMTFNPDGTLRPFVRGLNVGGNLMAGGEGPSQDDISPLVTPANRYAVLGRITHDLGGSVKATAELQHSRVYDDYGFSSAPNRGNITISTDNAFLPPAVRAAMQAAGETSFTFGRFNSDIGTRLEFSRESTQATLAFDGIFGKGWRWSAYYTHGEFKNDVDVAGDPITARFAQARDAVLSPTTGQPICRIALTDPTTPCVPINLFGFGAPSEAALAYVTGTNQQRDHQKLDAGGVSLRGEPLDLWAGPVSLAVGAEARREWQSQMASELDLQEAFQFFNFTAIEGSFSVKEAFGEVLVPLAKDLPLLKDLQFNGAIRESDYSTSGGVRSWKLGIIDEVVPGLKLRATRSRDIRAGNIDELFRAVRTGLVFVSDPLTGVTVNVPNSTGGNRSLLPEIGTTTTIGTAYAGLNNRLQMSVDYYDIEIRDVIGAISAQSIVNGCAAGNSDLCSRITRDADNVITAISSTIINLSRYDTTGVDIDVSYAMPSRTLAFLPGRMRFRLLASLVGKLTTYDGISTSTFLGSQGQAGVLGVPRWRATATAEYVADRHSMFLSGRYISAADWNRNIDLQNNRIPSYVYVDAGASYKLRRNVDVYLNVSNLLDKEPPPGSNGSPYYDVIGRFVVAGARVRF